MCQFRSYKRFSWPKKNWRIINALIESNVSRTKEIAKQIIKRCEKDSTIGFYKVKNKNSASMDVASYLFNKGYNVIFFEDGDEDSFENFIKKSDLVIANRIDERISSYKEKVFTRDLFLR